MIYRQGQGFSGDARIKLMELARHGSGLRAAARRREEAAQRKRAARKAQVESREAARRAKREAAHQRRTRMQAVSRFPILLDWATALIAVGIGMGVVLFTLPLWLFGLELGLAGWLVLLAVVASPLVVPCAYQALAARRLRRETAWTEAPEDHWKMLGSTDDDRTMIVRFARDVPDRELVADVLAAMAVRAGGWRKEQIAGTAITELSGLTLTLHGREKSSPRQYWQWCHALVEDALPTVAEAFPIESVRVAALQR